MQSKNSLASGMHPHSTTITDDDVSSEPAIAWFLALFDMQIEDVDMVAYSLSAVIVWTRFLWMPLSIATGMRRCDSP